MSKVVSKQPATAVSLQTAFTILNQKINVLENKHAAMFVSVERKIGQQDTFVNKIDTEQINTAISEIVDRMLSLLERVDQLENRLRQLEVDSPEVPLIQPKVEVKQPRQELKPEPKVEAKVEAPKKKRGTVKLEELDTSIGISFSN